MNKHPWQSKTLWLNFVLATLALVWPGFAEYVKEYPELCALLLSGINMALRMKTDSKIKFKKYNRLLPLLLFLLPGCASMLAPEFMDVDKSYPYELEMVVNGKEVHGAVVVDSSSSYDFKFIAKSNTAYFFIANCHRTVRTTETGGSGWGPWKKKSAFSYQFNPNIIEVESVCPMEISAFDSDGVKHAFGYIAFKNSDFSLPGYLTCSGITSQHLGVSVCNEAITLEQQIKFDVPVVVSSQDGCEDPVEREDNVFRYRMPKNKCMYGFMDSDKRVHRHIALGYSDLTLLEGE